jgi:hypothetical protein
MKADALENVGGFTTAALIGPVGNMHLGMPVLILRLGPYAQLTSGTQMTIIILDLKFVPILKSTRDSESEGTARRLLGTESPAAARDVKHPFNSE